MTKLTATDLATQFAQRALEGDGALRLSAKQVAFFRDLLNRSYAERRAWHYSPGRGLYDGAVPMGAVTIKVFPNGAGLLRVEPYRPC